MSKRKPMQAHATMYFLLGVTLVLQLLLRAAQRVLHSGICCTSLPLRPLLYLRLLACMLYQPGVLVAHSNMLNPYDDSRSGSSLQHVGAVYLVFSFRTKLFQLGPSTWQLPVSLVLAPCHFAGSACVQQRAGLPIYTGSMLHPV